MIPAHPGCPPGTPLSQALFFGGAIAVLLVIPALTGLAACIHFAWLGRWPWDRHG